MTKNGKNDWRPVTTTDALWTTTDVSLATTDSVLTTTGDHWQPLTTIGVAEKELLSLDHRV
jgi:hypothetical protein